MSVLTEPSGRWAAGERVRAPGAERRPGGDSRVKIVLYGVAAVLSVVVFVVPLVWALTRSFQPGTVITAPPQGSSFFRFHPRELPRPGRAGLHPPVGGEQPRRRGEHRRPHDGAVDVGRLRVRRFRGSGVAFGLVLVTLMIPFQAILTPLFLEFNAMHLTDSRLGLVLFYSTVNLPFGVFVMRTAFAAIPDALEEAARIDGAGTLRTLVDVLRPLVLPGMATTALYAFLAAWTEFLGALTFLTRQDLYTLPVSLVNLELGAYGQINYGYLAAGAVVAMIPCVILFVALQRYYVAGLSAGAVKG
jgi:multiple sugar transport system permease protein